MFSVGPVLNGFVLGGGGMAYTGIPAPADWPAVGCDVTGGWPLVTSSKSEKSS